MATGSRRVTQKVGRLRLLAAVAPLLLAVGADAPSEVSRPVVRSVATPTAASTATRPRLAVDVGPSVHRWSLAAQTDEDDDGLRFESASSHRVDPGTTSVHVAVDLTVENTEADQTSAFYIRQSYFPEIAVLVFAEAADVVAARDDGTPLAVRLEATEVPFLSVAVVDLAPDLFFGDVQRLRLTYRLPSQPPRSERVTRVNAGFAAVIPLPVGDPGLASVEVVVPESYDVTVEGTSSKLRREERGDETVLSESAIADPYAWDAVVVARDDDQLTSTEVSVAGHDVNVMSWPDDPEWASFITGILRDGMGHLTDLVGLDPPARAPLRVVETVTPYLYGYAGWYDPSKHLVEVGDDLDDRAVLHELAHIWINGDLFREKWISEAFAEELATRALERMGRPLAAPDPIVPGDPGAGPLNGWSDSVAVDPDGVDEERYGYQVSWTVLRTVTDEVGPEVLAKVLREADAANIAYQGDPDPEDGSEGTDWRRLLDLLEEVGGSTTAAGAFATYVVAPHDAGLLAERGAAREVYAGLKAAGGEWTAPLAVRQALAGWRFTAVAPLVDRSIGVLQTRDRIAEVLDPLGVDVPAGLERLYESARDLRDVQGVADSTLAVSRRLADAHAAADDDRGPLEWVGLLGVDLDSDLDRAADRLDQGDTDDALIAIDAVLARVADADEEGQQRVAGVVALALVLVTMVLARRSLVVQPAGSPAVTTVAAVRRSSGRLVRVPARVAPHAVRLAGRTVRLVRRRLPGGSAGTPDVDDSGRTDGGGAGDG